MRTLYGLLLTVTLACLWVTARAAENTTLVIVFADGRTQVVALNQSAANIARLEFTGGTTDAAIISQFDKGAEGWRVVSLGDNGPYGIADPPIYAVTENATGGNPGGYLSSGDPDGNSFFWDAPSKFLGNKRGLLGGELRFDMISEGGEYFPNADVILAGGGLTLTFRLPENPGTAWKTFRVPLTPGGWTRDTLKGDPATNEEMETVLTALTALRLRGEHRWGDETSRIDNVCLVPPVN